MNRVRILLIEDHLGERLSVMKVLSHMGAEVETAVTFSRACDLIKKREYNIMIAELILSHCPEVQGDGTQFWSFAQKIQPQTPLILIADQSPDLSLQLMKVTGNAPSVISKPIQPDTLQALLEQRLSSVKKLAS